MVGWGAIEFKQLESKGIFLLCYRAMLYYNKLSDNYLEMTFTRIQPMYTDGYLI